MNGKKTGGTPQQKHLERIEVDQSIQGIEQLDDTIRNDAGRHFFVSQAIQPGIDQGWYNPQTGRYVLGVPEHLTHTIDADNTSAATSSWTVPTGRKWIIHGLFGSNNNRATGLTVTIGGVVCNRTANNSVTQTLSYHMIGSSGSAVMQSGLVLDAGTTIALTDQAFVAADVVNHTIVYREI